MTASVLAAVSAARPWLCAAFGLAIALESLASHQAAAAASVVVNKPDITVRVTNRGTPKSPEGVIQNIELDGEVAGDQAAHDYGFHSIRLKLDIDCRRQRDRLKSIEVFSQPGLRGRPQTRRPSGDWTLPSSEAYLAGVIRAVCGQGAGERPQLAAGNAPATVSGHAVAALAPSSAGPAAPPTAEGGPTVQVAAADTQAGAKSALERLRKINGVSLDRLASRVDTASVKGKTVYRASLTGFASAAEARAFCETVRAARGKCFVR
jgi:hypothetical protein